MKEHIGGPSDRLRSQLEPYSRQTHTRAEREMLGFMEQLPAEQRRALFVQLQGLHERHKGDPDGLREEAVSLARAYGFLAERLQHEDVVAQGEKGAQHELEGVMKALKIEPYRNYEVGKES